MNWTRLGLVALLFAANGMPSVVLAGESGAARPPAFVVAQAAAKAGSSTQADLDALIKAARAEGQTLFYAGLPEGALKRVADAFTAKYGIKVNFIRLPGAQVLTRYATEAESGNIAADLVLQTGDSVPYAEEGIKKGWIEGVRGINLPAMKSGEFPSRLVTGPTAIIQIIPWLIAYNTDKVKGADVPKDWRDMVSPRFTNRLLLAEPASSDTYYVFLSVLIDKYGEGFLSQLRAQNPRWYASGVPAMQGLGAGEGDVEFPAIPAQINFVKDKGAPLASVKPDINTGLETHTILTAAPRAKNPNAARLLVNYLMTQEGNKVLNDDAGGMTVYDTSSLPKDYQPPRPPSQARIILINKLLGK